MSVIKRKINIFFLSYANFLMRRLLLPFRMTHNITPPLLILSKNRIVLIEWLSVCLQARQHGRQPAPPSPDPLHPAGVRAYSCQHWESLLSAPPPPPRPVSEPHSPCEIVEVYPACGVVTRCVYVLSLSMVTDRSKSLLLLFVCSCRIWYVFYVL